MDAVLSVGKPVILVSMTGSAMDMREADEKCAAVIEAWYPGGEGGKAVAELLFGKFSPSGKLPVTFYQSTEDLPEFTDYNMDNRTYRYFDGTPLYPFGYGLSYTKFEYEGGSVDITEDEITAECTVKNVGETNGYEKAQLYAVPIAPECRVPRSELRGCQAVYLKAGEEKKISFRIKKDALLLVDEEGNRFETKNGFKLYISGGQPDKRTEELTGVKPIELIVK
jgi:beta-glucosidase